MNTNISSFQMINESEVLFILLITLSMNIIAGESDFYEDRINTEWEIASNSELDALRGGFVLPNGMVIDFNFEKIIYRNGVEVFSSVFELPADIQLIQNGGSNIASDYASAILNSVIQNNLDNQEIRTVNTINIDIRNFDNINNDIINNEVFTSIISPTLIH